MKILIVTTMLLIITFLFYKASGNLKVTNLNIISYAFYSLMIFDFIGISLIYLGFNDHYLVEKILNNEIIIDKAYWIMVWTMIALPLTIIFSNKYIFKITNINKKNTEKNSNQVIQENKIINNKIFYLCIIIFIICFLSTIYVFSKIGYIPLFKFFNDKFNFSVERIKSGRNFMGNRYIKNIVMLIITPLISYISYAYMRVTSQKKWRVLFILSFILCIFVKTYDFEKAPIVYYIIYLFFIEVFLGKINKIKKMIPYAIGVMILVVGMYLTVGGYNGRFLSLSSGPISRIVITQPGTLLLHIDAFPKKITYLNGHSFPKYFSFLFGNGEYGVRSGREVMKLYNKNAIASGTAGVMSTVFIGEAYANFGMFGVFIAPILVGIILSSCLCLYLKSEKNVLNICLYLETIIIFTTVLQAGFIDFIYNVSLFVILITIFGIKCLAYPNYINNIKKNKVNKDIKIKDNKKRMIFHIPNYININANSGSNVRPLRMIYAFENSGYDVDVVMGYASDRKKKILEIKEKINNGIKYDFVYSESSTMPTLLTDKYHLPTHPLLDFSFLKFCKKNGLKVGLFYRDIHWKFDLYKKYVHGIKQKIAILFYKYDLLKYNKIVDIMFVPSNSFKRYIDKEIKCSMVVLPPGCTISKIKNNNKKDELDLFYVGGISDDIYNFEKLFVAVNECNKVKLTVCCRKKEWEKYEEKYGKFLNERINIVHESGKKLERFYQKSDICCLFFKPQEYINMSMPVKLFEYIGHNKPVIASLGTEAGKFVQKNDIGYVINYDVNELINLFNYLLNNKNELILKKNNIDKIIENNTWNARALEVIQRLKND